MVGHIMEQIHGMSVFEYGQSIGRSRIEIHKLVLYATISFPVCRDSLRNRERPYFGRLLLSIQLVYYTEIFPKIIKAI